MTPHISAVVSSTTTSPPCDVMWDKVVSVHDHHVPPYVIGIGASLYCPLCLHYFLPIGMETPAQNLFNGMLVNGRSIVVEAIALLKGRWKILQDLNTKIQFSLLCLKEGCSFVHLSQFFNYCDYYLKFEANHIYSRHRVFIAGKRLVSLKIMKKSRSCTSIYLHIDQFIFHFYN